MKQKYKVLEIQESDLKLAINDLIEELSQKDCQRVEFLRCQLSVLRELLSRPVNEWIEKESYNPF